MPFEQFADLLRLTMGVFLTPAIFQEASGPLPRCVCWQPFCVLQGLQGWDGRGRGELGWGCLLQPLFGRVMVGREMLSKKSKQDPPWCDYFREMAENKQAKESKREI